MSLAQSRAVVMRGWVSTGRVVTVSTDAKTPAARTVGATTKGRRKRRAAIALKYATNRDQRSGIRDQGSGVRGAASKGPDDKSRDGREAFRGNYG